MEALKPLITQAVRDAINADARRATSGKQPQPKAKDEGAAPAPAFDTTRFRELDRAVARAGMAEKLSGTAYKRMERAFSNENPDEAEAWVTDYFAGFGVGQTPQPQQQTQNANPTTPAPQGQPASDRGAPAAAKTPLEEMNVLEMSAADRDALIKSKGLKFYQERLTASLRGKPFPGR